MKEREHTWLPSGQKCKPCGTFANQFSIICPQCLDGMSRKAKAYDKLIQKYPDLKDEIEHD